MFSMSTLCIVIFCAMYLFSGDDNESCHCEHDHDDRDREYYDLGD